jgi:hypothetical protein
MGELEGLFVAEKSDIDNIIGKTIYFGEVLGKHSDIDVDITEEDLTIVSTDSDFIDSLVLVLGTTVSGYNPLDYYYPDEEENDGY